MKHANCTTQIPDEPMKVVGPIPSSDMFDMEDVKQLIHYERSRRIRPVLQAAADMDMLQLMDRRVYTPTQYMFLLIV